MAANVRHRRAPEIVPEDLPHRTQPEHVLVHRDGRDVVVHKVPLQPVKVAPDGHQTHEEVHPPVHGVVHVAAVTFPTRLAKTRTRTAATPTGAGVLTSGRVTAIFVKIALFGLRRLMVIVMVLLVVVVNGTTPAGHVAIPAKVVVQGVLQQGVFFRGTR